MSHNDHKYIKIHDRLKIAAFKMISRAYFSTRAQYLVVIFHNIPFKKAKPTLTEIRMGKKLL